MVLICSDENDFSTHKVIDWLNYFKIPYCRVSSKDKLSTRLEFDSTGFSNFILSINGQDYSSTDIKKYWYRRSYLNLQRELFSNKNSDLGALNSFINNENIAAESFINNYFKEYTFHIGAFEENFLKKLNILKVAAEVGLTIPSTLVTTKKSDVIDFCTKHKKIISKSIQDGFSFTTRKYSYSQQTILLTIRDVERFPENFPIILFQENLRKKFELRIFYLNKNFYASAIFSQNDSKTKIDFRNYNHEKPNRICAFSIPDTLKQKLINLMEYFKLTSGSFDIVYTKKKEFVFLEINPIGQFEQVSNPCNYNLHKVIAESLI